MRFLRTASTHRLLATLAGVVAAIAAGTAIAVAATGSGPVPRAKPLAQALHGALAAKPVAGISAHIQFTNNLISSSDFTGDAKDPILQGASGRLWLSKTGNARLELQTSNGDSQVVVHNGSFWISDPTSKTVYEGTLPAEKPSSATAGKAKSKDAVPTVGQIQTELNHLIRQVNLTGARTSNPTDVAGQPAYSVSVSPKHDGGLLGAAQVAWDAVTGTPLDLAVYARGDRSPVLELKATDISFGAIPASDLAVSPPAGDKVVKVAAPATTGAHAKAAKAARHAVTGVRAVGRKVPFSLAAPAKLVGLPRQEVRLLDWGGSPAALATYGRNLGGIAVIEQRATGAAASTPSSGSHVALPTVSINGATGTELSTPLGTVVRWTSNGVAYTVLGSVPSVAAEQAARALTP